MKRRGIRKNNRGDSLILVIGCIALLSIIGVVLLAKTMDNRNMKLAEEQAQASFAGAESGSGEMVTIIETAALGAIENAFGDMMLEYSLLGTDTEREDRYKALFTEQVKNALNENELQYQLEQALGGAAITDLTVSCPNDAEIDTTVAEEEGYTKTVRMEGVVFSYNTGGSRTTITTDICVRAAVPNVAAGFNSGVSCEFLDFALISDGNVSISHENTGQLLVKGNVYTGGDLITDGASAVTKITKARKLLVKNNFKALSGGQVWVNADGLTLSEGEGIWARGIYINGSTFDTTDVNLYVRDDLTVEGKAPTVAVRGSDSEYVGYSGNTGASFVNHEMSSAITINEIDFADTNGDSIYDKGLMLDMSGLARLFINGNSYICENSANWGSTADDDDNVSAADGVLQGESVAYKDMQALYLYPGSCLPQNHNPIIGKNVTVGTASLDFEIKRDGTAAQIMNLRNYVNEAQPYVTRTARLDNGATFATYVYLNFASEEKAAQYVQDYLATFLGDGIKSQVNHLGSFSKIDLPANTTTLSNAIEYSGSALTIRPGASASEKTLLNIAALLAKQRYNGLFSSLRAEGSSVATEGYRMVRNGILSADAFNESELCGNKEYSVYDESTGDTYYFYAHDGNLTIDSSGACDKYRTMNGILLVNGDLTLTAAPVKVNGLILVTGNIINAAGAELQANPDIVELLLTNEDVAKYFRVYGESSGHGFLSTEAVEVSFEKWKKN